MFTEEIAAVFPSFPADDEGAQELLQGDFRELGAEEAVREFTQAEEILEGLISSAESISVSLYVCLSEAKSRAVEARRVAQKYAQRS